MICLAPDKIKKQMEVGERCTRSTLLSGSFARFLYRHARAKFIPTALWETLSPTEWLFRKMALDLHMQTGNWLVSRELTEGAGPWNTELLGDDDGEYFCRVLLQSEGVQFVPAAKAYYRTSGTSSLSYIGQSDRKRDAQWRSMLLHIQYLRSLEDSPRTHEACVKYLQNWLVFFYPERMDLVAKLGCGGEPRRLIGTATPIMEICLDPGRNWRGGCDSRSVLLTVAALAVCWALGQDLLATRKLVSGVLLILSSVPSGHGLPECANEFSWPCMVNFRDLLSLESRA